MQVLKVDDSLEKLIEEIEKEVDEKGFDEDEDRNGNIESCVGRW